MVMVATSWNFSHIRSRRGLARMVRKYARVIRKIVVKQFGDNKELMDRIAAGDIPGTMEDWKKVFDDYIAEEGEIDKILKDEDILMNEERKGIQQEQIILDKAIEEIAKAYPDKVRKIQEFFGQLTEAMNAEAMIAHKIRIEEKDMLLDRERIMRYATMLGTGKFGDIMQTRLMRVEGWEQSHAIVTEEQDEKMVENVLRKLLNAARGGSETDVDAALDELVSVGDNLKKVFIAETEETYKLVHELNIIHVHLLHRVMNLEPKRILEVSQKGLPKENIEKLKSMYQRFAELHNKSFTYYSMAKYVERRSSSVRMAA